MLTASPSPRLHASESTTFAGPRNGNHQRSGSSSSNLAAAQTSPIVKAHLAHVYAAESSRYPAFTTPSTNQSIVSQSNKTSHQWSHPSNSRSVSLRSTGTQTSPEQLGEKFVKEAQVDEVKSSMVDAQTQYSPPENVSQTTRSEATSISPLPKLELRDTATSIESSSGISESPESNTAVHQVANASMPAGPTGIVSAASTATTTSTSTSPIQVTSESASPPSVTKKTEQISDENRSSPPSKRNHSVAVATQALSIQNENESNENDGTPGPLKKMRPDDAEVKLMPTDYSLATTRDLVLLISSMLMELIRYNDAIPLHNNQLTRFHSRAPPGISVIEYLQRLTTHATLSPPILLSMVYYIDKLCALYPAFTISSLTVHRFLITAATVASKGLSDSFWTNKTYARVGGVSLRELALLELEFLVRVQWRIVPKPEVLIDYYRSLVQRTTGYAMESEQIAVNSSNGSHTESRDAG